MTTGTNHLIKRYRKDIEQMHAQLARAELAFHRYGAERELGTIARFTWPRKTEPETVGVAIYLRTSLEDDAGWLAIAGERLTPGSRPSWAELTVAALEREAGLEFSGWQGDPLAG